MNKKTKEPQAKFSSGLPQLVNGRVADIVCIAILAAVVSYFWWPALLDGKTIIHADSSHHGLTLLTLLHQWLYGSIDTLLWTRDLYGGHPLFAEGQGGFLNPTNLIGAAFLDPLLGFAVTHWLNMFLAGLGVYVLCRTLALVHFAALFAAIATIFSSVWLMGQNNLTVSGTIAWLPWLLAAVQYWLARPGILRACLMALPATLLVYSGYPHLTYGAAIYLACFLPAWFVTRQGRTFLLTNAARLVPGAALALLLALALSAVQLLPLVELVGQSHRQAGLELPFRGLLGFETYVTALLFFTWDVKSQVPIGVYGTLMGCGLFVIAFLLKPPPMILGHMTGAFLLVNLGIADASPIFNFVYDHGLIPGIRSFRIMHPFLMVGTIGLSVVAGYALSQLSKEGLTSSASFAPSGSLAQAIILICCTVAFFLLSLLFLIPGISVLNLVVSAAGFGAVLLMRHLKYYQLIAPCLALLLVAEGIALRFDVYDFYDRDVLNAPDSVTLLQSEQETPYFYTYSSNSRTPFIFGDINDPELDTLYRNFLASLTPMPGMIWGLSSIGGSLALQLERRALLEQTLLDESNGLISRPPGLRIMDILGVRYLTFHRKVETIGFEELLFDKDSKLRLYRNIYALPSIRTYDKAVFVDDAARALDLLMHAQERILVLESGSGDALTPGVQNSDMACKSTNGNPRVDVTDDTVSHYSVIVRSDCSGWLYVNDAYFPGWTALVNGREVPLYPAQVLGKAVQFSKGTSEIEIYYRAQSFTLGATVSALAWFGLLVFFARRYFSGVRVQNGGGRK